MNLNQVTVPTTDVARAIEFYVRLGLKLIVKSLPKYARFECPEGQSTFSVHWVESLSAPSPTVVYFECAALDQKVASLMQAGVTFDSLPTDQPWLWREAYLQDSDGNRICLFRAGSNRLNPPWRVA